MRKIGITLGLCALAGFLSAQNTGDAFVQEIEKSWVKDLPFTTVDFPQGVGNVLSVAQNPDNPYEMYLAIEHSGLWYTDNNGASYVPLLTREISQNVQAMGIDWQTQTLWIANDQGVFFSTDQGRQWQKTSLAISGGVTQFLFFPEGRIFVSVLGNEKQAPQGVFASADAGKSWKQVFGQVGVSHMVRTAHNTLLISAWDRDFSDPEKRFSGKSSGIYQSTNFGENWQHLTGVESGFAQGNLGRICVAPHGEKLLYALLDNRNPNPNANHSLEKLSPEAFLALSDKKIQEYLYERGLEQKFSVVNIRQILEDEITTPNQLSEYLGAMPAVLGAELYVSENAGKTWQKKDSPALKSVFFNKGYEVMALVVNPKNPKDLILSGIPLLRSLDGGASWKLLKNNPLENKVNQLLLSHRQLMYLTQGGFFQSFDLGKNWKAQNIPQTVKINSLNVGNPEDNSLWVSVQGSGIWKKKGTWQQLSPENGNLVVSPENAAYVGQSFGEIFSLQEKKSSVLPVQKSAKQRFAPVTPVMISPQNSSILYSGGNHLFQSLNKGRQWNSISGDLTNGEKAVGATGVLSAVAESPFQFGLLYTGSDDGMIYVSKNGGVSWQMIYSSFPQPNRVACLLASSHQKNRVYAVLGSRNAQTLVFRSENNGKTWENLQSNLPNQNANVILEDSQNEQVLYLGTDSGLYVSFDMGERWHPFSKNLPRISVSQIAINPQRQTLYVGTQGNGIFQADIKALKELRAAVMAQLFYPLFATYSVDYSPKWGERANAWEAPVQPVLFLDAFASEAGNGLKVSILKDDIELKSFTWVTQTGFNFIPYDLTVTDSGRVEYEKKFNQQLTTKASDGHYYLPKGTYQLRFENDMIQETRELIVR